MQPRLLSFAVSAALISTATLADETTALPSMMIQADFRPAEAQDLPVSLTTFDDEIIESRGAQHIEDVLNLAPNVNVASGASRGQYFQIRGIGERSQFAAPLNPSVGLIIDGIDFSRTGGAATLFDIEQVEVLRGPQGTRFGTNALAGAINMRSKRATDELDVNVESTLANYNTRSAGVAVGGPLVEDTLLGRVAFHRLKSDGYMDNDFLNRDNTQNRDEITARGHLKWHVNNDLDIDLNLLHLNIDNGYDAFTFDNSRNSLADQPGEDKQRTNAFALKGDWRASSAVQVQSTATYSKSDLLYSYDVDWSNRPRNDAFIQTLEQPGRDFCLGISEDEDDDPGVCPFNAFEAFDRTRENYSFELRALSNEDGRIFNDTTDWTIGAYYLNQDESVTVDSPYIPLQSQYETQNTAVFGQLDTYLTDRLTLINGLRVGYFQADYTDDQMLDLDPSEMLFGGKVGLEFQYNENQLLYSTLSRGYKSGGVNNAAGIADRFREFDTEYMWNLELGAKSRWLGGDLLTNVALFYGIRKDAQVKNSKQDGFTFIDYQQNAAKGTNAGLEFDLDWLINDQWRALASLGLLYTNFDDYEVRDNLDVTGREQAHAPAYQFSLGGEFYPAPKWVVRANIEGKDEFYFSNSHNIKSSSYVISNASVEYQNQDWRFTLWARNLFDKDYATRGFFFANDPTIGYAERKYVQYGDPRTVGLTVSYDY